MTAPVTGEHLTRAQALVRDRSLLPVDSAIVPLIAQALADAEARGAARVSIEATTHGGDR